MLTHVVFRSNAFPPHEYEEDQGFFGERLAKFLYQEISRVGVAVEPPFAEDWGWVVPVRNPSFRLWIGCGSYYEYDDGYLCFIEPHQRFVRKYLLFGKVDVSPAVESLRQAIDGVLSAHPDIRDVRWFSYEEFNRT